MKTILKIAAVIIPIVWAIGYFAFNAPESVHMLLLIDLLIVIKLLKPEKDIRITRITSERNYIK